MESSQNLPLYHQDVLPIVPHVPPYVPIPVQPYVLVVDPPIRGIFEVLRKQNTILDNLRIKLATGYQELIDKRAQSPNTRRERSAGLPPHPVSPRCITACHGHKKRESSRNRKGQREPSRSKEEHREPNIYEERQREPSRCRDERYSPLPKGDRPWSTITHLYLQDVSGDQPHGHQQNHTYADGVATH